MEEALVSLLLADASLAALVSTRIYWGKRPQDVSTLPAVILSRVYGGRDYAMSGATGLVESRVQCDCYGASYGATKATARALMTAVNAYSATTGGVHFQRISIDGERDTNETESAASGYLFRTSIDLLIWHDE